MRSLRRRSSPPSATCSRARRYCQMGHPHHHRHGRNHELTSNHDHHPSQRLVERACPAGCGDDPPSPPALPPAPPPSAPPPAPCDACKTGCCDNMVGGRHVLCGGHGTCASCRCACAPGWRGACCNVPVRSCPVSPGGKTCCGHGTCDVDGVCKCSSGWAGEGCCERGEVRAVHTPSSCHAHPSV